MESGFIHPIQLLFDINFLAEDDFSFITFMRKMKTNNVFLVVSESGKIGNKEKGQTKTKNIIYLDYKVHLFFVRLACLVW